MLEQQIREYINTSLSVAPLFLCGDIVNVLREIPSNSIDCCMTSPPYWGKRIYINGGIGVESDFKEYINNVMIVTAEIYRVLKSTGSFWLNIGDSYKNKQLLDIPHRLSISMIDQQQWILRNTVIWNKVKGGPDNANDKLRNVYEPIFHFVKKATGYYYDVDAIRNTPKHTKVLNGSVVSATGVTGIRYKRQIELSEDLSAEQKQNAFNALKKMLEDIEKGNVSDFRMIIKGRQRTTHSDSENVSGRAKELQQKGFYFIKYNPKGSKPSDVWDIIPEDTQQRKLHFAPYPEDLCRIPIIATCPQNGIVLDPFCGTGTTNFVSNELKRRSIGIDISQEYLNYAKERCKNE